VEGGSRVVESRHVDGGSAGVADAVVGIRQTRKLRQRLGFEGFWRVRRALLLPLSKSIREDVKP